ncbi:MAG: dihydrolipoyl dehydrogenase [Enhygromyxa sp.]
MSKPSVEVDVAVIGAGTAGLVARRQALNHGAERVLLIEGGAHGTTCARVGCMPSKLLIAAAEAAAAVRGAPAFGVEPGELRIDGAAVMDRVRRERDGFVASVLESIEKIPARNRLDGWARFIGPSSLEVEGEGERTRVDAKAIVIATGSTPYVAPSLRELGDRLLTSDTLFELPTLPRSLAVVGIGAIGLELGQALAQLGVRTTVLDIGTRLPVVQSPAMQAVARELFERRLDLRLGIRELTAARTDEGVRLSWIDADDTRRELDCEQVLAATGRRPQLARLELQNAGLELDDRGAPLDFDERTMQVADLPIFLAGDINGDRPLLHEAAAEGRIAGINAARYPEVRAHPRYVELAIMFSDPNVARVGSCPGPQGEGEAWEFGEVDFGKQGRSRVIDEGHGRARIYAERGCGVILGAELIGPRVEHLAHLLAWAIEQRMTVPEALAMPYYHPVIEEGLRTAIQQLGRKLKMAPKPRPLDCGPGT